MSYIGNEPTSVAFLTDTFSGNGSTTAFTMSAAPATTTSILVAVTGVLQDPSTYSVVGTTLTFSAAPPSGTGNISVRYLGIPASGVTTTAYRTITEFTATAGQTTFTPPSYTPGFISVFRNGALLSTSDYTATNGTTVVLGSAASASDLVTIESFYVSSVLNALPQTGGTLNGSLVVNGATGQNPLIVQNNTTEAMRVNSSGNVGIGTSSPNEALTLQRGSGASAAITLQGNGNTSTNEVVISQSAFSDFFLYNRASASVRFGTANTERMRIDSSGNVGIGTSSPSTKLEVYGQRIRVNATPDPGIEFANTAAVKGYVFYDTTADVMTMRHASALGINVNSSGNITTPSSAAFQVSGTTSPVSSGNKVPWTYAKFNRGNYFDTTNSRFTAPVSGVYWMSVSIFLTTTNSPARPSFRVNGSDYSVGFDAAQTVTNVTGAEITNILSLHMTLNAGDYVEVFARTGGGSLVFYSGHTWWSGNLIG